MGTGDLRNCDPALVGRSDSGHPNENPQIAGAWEEYVDRRTRLKYWYNTITQEVSRQVILR